jgi:hypothetical protein
MIVEGKIVAQAWPAGGIGHRVRYKLAIRKKLKDFSCRENHWHCC